MTIRERILVVLLWLLVIAHRTWVGGTLYQMLVIVPMWSASPPESVRAFFQGTDYNRTIFNFFGPPFIAGRNLLMVAALSAGWHLPRHRFALLLAAACFAFAVVFTLLYIYPINAVLFEQAGGSHSAEEIRAMADRWIFADRLRFAVGVVGFLAVLWAFRLPMPAPRHLPAGVRRAR
jgi:uncharacterized membrane protein